MLNDIFSIPGKLLEAAYNSGFKDGFFLASGIAIVLYLLLSSRDKQ